MDHPDQIRQYRVRFTKQYLLPVGKVLDHPALPSLALMTLAILLSKPARVILLVAAFISFLALTCFSSLSKDETVSD